MVYALTFPMKKNMEKNCWIFNDLILEDTHYFCLLSFPRSETNYVELYKKNIIEFSFSYALIMMVCTNAKLPFFVHINVCCAWADCREYTKVSKPNISFFMNTYSACTVHLYDVSLTTNRIKNASLFFVQNESSKGLFGLIVQMEHSQSALKTIRILYHLVCHTHYDKLKRKQQWLLIDLKVGHGSSLLYSSRYMMGNTADMAKNLNNQSIKHF